MRSAELGCGGKSQHPGYCFFPLQQISPAQAVSHLAEARPEGRLVDTRKQLGGGNVM